MSQKTFVVCPGEIVRIEGRYETLGPVEPAGTTSDHVTPKEKYFISPDFLFILTKSVVVLKVGRDGVTLEKYASFEKKVDAIDFIKAHGA